MNDTHVGTSYRAKRAIGLLAPLVQAQYGVIAIWQILELGIPRHWVKGELARGRLHQVHRGVYAVGHPTLTPLGRCVAAALAGGPSGALGFAGAAWVFSLVETLPEVLHVWSPTRRRNRPRLRFHEGLPRDEVTVHEGVPVSIPARTVFDCAATMELHRVERMMERGEEAQLHSQLSYYDLLARYPRKPGAPALRQVLGRREETGAHHTRSDREMALLHLCDRKGLPRPLTCYLVRVRDRQFELDAFWPDARLALEYDSWEFHSGRTAFREDRIRDRILATAGIHVVRATAHDLGAGADAFAADLMRLRARRCSPVR
jgi:hypothetical protein